MQKDTVSGITEFLTTLGCSFTHQVTGSVGCCQMGRFQSLHTSSTSWAFLPLPLHWSSSVG